MRTRSSSHIKKEKIAAALLVAICLVSAFALVIHAAIAKNDSSQESKFRRSDIPILHLPVDEEKWLPIVPPDPSELPPDKDDELFIEIDVYDVKTKKVKKITKNFTKSEKTTSKLLGRQGSLPSELILESPISYGDRIRVTPTTDYPWRTICKLRMWFPSGQYMGSGFIIDDYHILTAGHCVYNPILDEWAIAVEVIPALDEGYMPFYHAWATEITINSYWYDYGSYEDDFAILTLDRNIGSFTGWMGLYTSYPSDPIYTSIVNTAGYPGDLDGGWNMYFDSDLGAGATTYNHWYYMDTRGGQSGSPVWYYDDPDRYVLSIVAYETPPADPNFGTRLSEYWFDLINFVFDRDTPPIDYANLIDDGQDWSGFSPTQVVPGVTPLSIWSDTRNIGTAESGGFQVSYYASTDTEITASDHLIGTVSIPSIPSFNYHDSDWSGTFSIDIPSGTYWVGWIIDETHLVSELIDNGENDNIAYKESYQLIVETPTHEPSLDSYSVQVGDVITVTGDTGSVTPGVTVEAYWDIVVGPDAFLLNTTTSELAGSYEVEITVPDAVNGSHYVWIKDTATESTAQSSAIDVIPSLVVDPQIGLSGDRVTVSAYGFNPSTEIWFGFFNETWWTSSTLLTSPSTVETDDYGSAIAEIIIPDGLVFGSYTINCTDGENWGFADFFSSVLFEDDFESGDFSAWDGTRASAGESASVTTDLPHHGSYSGYFTSNGGSGYEYAHSYVSVSTLSELYARGNFRVSQSGIAENGDRFVFIRFRSGSEPLAAVGWHMNGGDIVWTLGMRDGTGWAMNYSASSPSLDQWYSVELHWVEGASSGFGELYVDGVLMCSSYGLNTAALGSVEEIRFGLANLFGCSSTTVYGDCFIASLSYIGPELEPPLARARLTTIVRGNNNKIYCKILEDSSWSGWNTFPGATPDRVAGAILNGDLHIVVKGMTGGLYHGWMDLDSEAFSGWSKLSGDTPSAPVLTASDSKLYLVVRGLNSKIYYREWDGSWGGWRSTPGATIEGPGATLVGDELHVVVIGTNNRLYHGIVNTQDYSFNGWTGISGATPSQPVLADNESNVFLVVQGNNDRVYLNEYKENWSGWTGLPGATGMSPGAAVLGDELHLVVKGMTGGLYHGSWNITSSSWNGWTRITGDTPSPPTLATD